MIMETIMEVAIELVRKLRNNVRRALIDGRGAKIRSAAIMLVMNALKRMHNMRNVGLHAQPVAGPATS
jgi:hypothetical protein